MITGNKKDSLLFLCGDAISFVLSLFIALSIRGGSFPSLNTLTTNLLPFSFVFVLWILSFFVAGLYEKQRISRRRKLPVLLIQTQVFNSVLAIIIFYSIPVFGITPKTILFFCIVFSFIFSFVWRIFLLNLFSNRKKEKALLIADGKEVDMLLTELNSDIRSGLEIIPITDIKDISLDNFREKVIEKVSQEKVSLVIVDFGNPKIREVVSGLYELLFSKVRFVDFCLLFEEVFDRLPVETVSYGWFIENLSLTPKPAYDILKRMMDILLALPVLLVFCVVYPFVYLGTKIQDGGKVFFRQNRIGKNGDIIHIIKFRSMKDMKDLDVTNDSAERITLLGAFLRRSRIDELPQIWNVFKGDISIIGPRPEIPDLVREYQDKIPYYNVRHIIKPGLSGWAQIYHDNHPHHGTAVEETKEKLSYDLFYIKNRSFALDIVIALKTIKTILSQKGR